MSARVSGISGVTQSFDPLTSERVLALQGRALNRWSLDTFHTTGRT
jgi:hypothetical protein